MYHGKPKVQFQINSYLRLADLCGPDEQDLKVRYMNQAEKLLLGMEDNFPTSFDEKNIEVSIQSFLNDHAVNDLNGEHTAKIYKVYKEYCSENGFRPVSHIDFSRKVCGIRNMTKKTAYIGERKVRVFVSLIP